MTASSPGTAAPPLAIRLFGPFEARVHGAPLPRLRSRKGPWLLALLTLRREREVSRSWLAGTLWPDSDTAQAALGLRTTLFDLRRALGDEAEPAAETAARYQPCPRARHRPTVIWNA